MRFGFERDADEGLAEFGGQRCGDAGAGKKGFDLPFAGAG